MLFAYYSIVLRTWAMGPNILTRMITCYGGELGAECAGGVADILEMLSSVVVHRIGSTRVDYTLGQEARI